MTRAHPADASLMRSLNRAATLDLIREEGPLTRSEIARKLKLSLPTVMRVTDELMTEDFVTTLDETQSTGGRPANLLAFKGTAYSAVGVDLGGSKMFGTVADLTGNIEHQIYIPWEDQASGDRLEQLCRLIEDLMDAPRPSGQQLRGIGIGAPGITLQPEGIVTWAPSLGWRDLALKEILSQRFDVPVFVENDVNLAALGEFGFGAGRGATSLVCIAVGTGIGAGIILDGALYRGCDQAAGEIGYCVPGVKFLGKVYDEFGALESLASATGVVNRAWELLESAEDSSILLDDLNAEQVFCAAREGAGWARDVVSETVDYLSVVIANVSALLNPEVVVLGGGVARSADLLIEPILERLDGVIPHIPKIVASELDRRAAVMGAIMLVLHGTTDDLLITQRT